MKPYMKTPEGYERIVLPIPGSIGHMFGFLRKRDNLRVITTHPERLKDGRDWLHVSCSFYDKDPSYADLAEVKRLFIGDDRVAFQKFPERAKHVNIHQHTLHLWAVWDGEDPTPDFTEGGNTI